MKSQHIGMFDRFGVVNWNGTRLGLLLAVGLCLTACKQEVKVADVDDPSGIYTLVSVDGKRVPAAVSHDGAELQVRSGTFAINPDGTCSSKKVFVPPSGVESTREVTATYTQDGGKLNMEWKGAGRTTGTIEGDTFTMNNEGMIFVYQR
jgi:hypothetical protein